MDKPQGAERSPGRYQARVAAGPAPVAATLFRWQGSEHEVRWLSTIPQLAVMVVATLVATLVMMLPATVVATLVAMWGVATLVTTYPPPPAVLVLCRAGVVQ